VLYAEIERFWKNGRKKEGAFLPHVGPFRARNSGMALLVTWGTGLRPERGSYAMLSSFGRCYMGKNESPFSLTPSIAPAKLAVCAVFAVLPSNFKRPYLFNRSADLGEFYVKSKGFPCSTQKSSDFGRMDEKRGGLSSSCGAFSGLKIPGMALLVTWGTGLRTERDSYAMLSSFGRCYMGKNESPFKFHLRLSPRQSWLFVPIFAVLPSNFKRPYLFNRLADLGEFYVEIKGFSVLYAEIERFWKNGRKKRGPFFLMWGLFRAKNPGMALLVTWGTGLRAERDSYAMLSSFGRCYMQKDESPFKFTFVYRPGKVGCLCCFRCFALQLQKAISFQPLGRFG